MQICVFNLDPRQRQQKQPLQRVFKVHFTTPGIGSTLLSAELILDYIMATFCKGCTQAQVEQDAYIKVVQKTTLLVKLLP